MSARCGICGRPGARLDAGGDLGAVHRACFDHFDRQDEAMELMGVVQRSSWPLPAEPRWHRRNTLLAIAREARP